MSKWKCGICNSEFDNFQAQGFGGDIYCPLCYYKELYKRDKKEIERLNNIINELEKWLEENIKTKPLLTTYFFECDGKQKSISGIELEELKRVLNKLKALKEE